MDANTKMKIRAMVKAAQEKSFYERVKSKLSVGDDFHQKVKAQIARLELRKKTRYLMGAGSGLLGYAAAKAIQGDLTEEEKRRQTRAGRVMRALAPIGAGLAAGYGGYHLGEGLANMEEGMSAEGLPGGAKSGDPQTTALERYKDLTGRADRMGLAAAGLGGTAGAVAVRNAAKAIAHKDHLVEGVKDINKAIATQHPGAILAAAPSQTVNVPRKAAVGGLLSDIWGGITGKRTGATMTIPGYQERLPDGKAIRVVHALGANGATIPVKMTDPFAKVLPKESPGFMNAVSKKLDSMRFGKAIKSSPRAFGVLGPAVSAVMALRARGKALDEASALEREIISKGWLN